MCRGGTERDCLRHAVMVGLKGIGDFDDFRLYSFRRWRFGDGGGGDLKAEVPVVDKALRFDNEQFAGDHHFSDGLEELLVIGGGGDATAFRGHKASKAGQCGCVVAEAFKEVEGRFKRPAGAHLFTPQ